MVTWYREFKESIFFRKLFFLAFVTSLILFRTLLNRNLWMNPLSNVMDGWSIWETVNGEQKLTTECIENVLMMVPFSAVVMWTFHGKAGNGWNNILWLSGKIEIASFGYVLAIRHLLQHSWWSAWRYVLLGNNKNQERSVKEKNFMVYWERLNGMFGYTWGRHYEIS